MKGDVLGHEFMGEVVELGPAVQKLRTGDRMVVGSVLACGGCWYCQTGQPHAEYVRVPFADIGAFKVPDGVDDDAVVFASAAMPTGWMAADFCGLRGGEVVAVWGAGGAGQMAARSAQLLGAQRVIVIHRLPDRLSVARDRLGVETVDYSHTDVLAALGEMTGGRGPDACIEAVGMEAHDTGPAYAYDRVKQAVRLQTDRPTAVRQAIMACRGDGPSMTSSRAGNRRPSRQGRS